MYSPHFDVNLNVMPRWKLGSCKAKRLGCTSPTEWAGRQFWCQK